MAESKRDEHERLQDRTDELASDHANLALDKTPFNKTDHDQHTANLRQHKEDLADHKARDNEP
jgi:hypothetical protein